MTSPYSQRQLAILSISESCQDLGFAIRLDECVSYCFNGHKPFPHFFFLLVKGYTTNISAAPTGETIGITPTQSKRLSAKKLCSKIYESLARIDERPSCPWEI